MSDHLQAWPTKSFPKILYRLFPHLPPHTEALGDTEVPGEGVALDWRNTGLWTDR